MTFAKILPMAFVMIAGPQILSAIFLATSQNWRRNSAAYVLGAAISISLFVTLAFLLLNGVSEGGASDDTLYYVVLGLLVVAMVHVFLARKTAEPPQWMGKLQSADPKLAFRLGLLLLGIFPTDILTSAAVGSYLAAHDAPLVEAVPFIALTLLFLALPSLTLLLFRERATTALPSVRDWMNDNSWVINEIVIAFFVLITISDLAG